ncbi:MAG: lamin tail domain-containing protein [Planctomycetota bacterium]
MFTRFLFSGTAPKLAARWPRSSEKKIGVRISTLLPNSEGRDEGNEWLRLKNGANEPVDLAGWQLRDEAGHTVRLNGVLAPKAELKVRLAARQMPLNNSGDEIELLDAQGQVVDKVSYVAGQVSPGREIRFPRSSRPLLMYHSNSCF